jgi:organic radical activating enzyme|tara:strand:+ start:1746 stop:3257 length:1512 start_codon:yes stop_codon:yes gene_type:complete
MKILCLGNNLENTDKFVSILAKKSGVANNGLVESHLFEPTSEGYYHTSLVDVNLGGITALASKFDRIQMLDLPYSQWSSWKLLLSTYKLCKDLYLQGYDVIYKQNKNIRSFEYWKDYVQKNKSFCIYPWVNFVEAQNHNVLCARSTHKLVTTKDKLLGNWQTNKEYDQLRQKMLNGERLDEHCRVCYDYENKGIESYRQFETQDWAAVLNLQTVEDLKNIHTPYYYEIRLSNKCNLMCRGCKPEFSHLIEKEFDEHNIDYPIKDFQGYTGFDVIDIASLTKQTRVYLTGGEPTVMKEVYEFMRECIAENKTDFDFTLGTNCQFISDTFLELADHFTHMNFAVSLDGYGQVNDYWRWLSNWDTIVANMKLLEQHGHNVSINIVPGIYNVTNLHLLYEFLDQEFPLAGMYLQINHNPWQSAYNHPNKELVIESMQRCRETTVYRTDGKSNKTSIDSLLNHYSDPNFTYDVNALREFFVYNDKLDKARGSQLGDYIPELEECRKLV